MDIIRWMRHDERPVAGRLAKGVACAMLLLLALAPVAAACNMPLRSIGPVELSRKDLRRPMDRPTTQAAWKLHGEWRSVMPQLNQVVRTRSAGTHMGVSFARQRSISVDALPPDTYGWRWTDDDNPSTPACQLAGKPEWESPRVLVLESRTMVRVLAVSRRTPGSTVGCEFETLDSVLPCPNLTTRVVQLQRPLGTRRLVFERLPGDDWFIE